MSVAIFSLVFLFIYQYVCGASLFDSRIDPNQLELDISYRLPNNTSPVLYDLVIETWVDEGRLDYNGSVNIRIKVLENNTNSIILHSRNLNILEWNLRKVVYSELVAVEVENPVFDSVTDFLTFSLVGDVTLEIDVDYRLFITFSGMLREEQNGFYRSSYSNSEGREVWFANTIFQLAEARTAFPCYDEPGKKAHFNIKIIHSPNYHVVSNTEVMDIRAYTHENHLGRVFQMIFMCISENEPSWRHNENRRQKTHIVHTFPSIPDSTHVVTTFRIIQPTMTYVLAFLISDFPKIQNNETSIIQNVYAPPNKINDMHFALEASVKTMAVFEEYLGMSYSLTKFDQVGLPNFAPEATENWGLVQYNEDYLVYNPTTSRTTQQFTVARLISHELSHQWFGNLVSPTWWTYSWLLEGFAVLAEYEMTDIAYPHLRSNEMFPHRITQWIFNPDSLDTSRALTLYGESKEEIEQLFDGLAFFKAGSIFRMTENFLTPPVWRDGLNRYLTTHQLGNAAGDDFFAALQEAVTAAEIDLPTSVQDILSTWTLQKGFPIVEVIRQYDNKGTINFTQQRYVSTTKNNSDGLTWWIPINIATKYSNFQTTTPDYWLTKGLDSVVYEPSTIIPNDDWIVINKQQTGYYRVNYDRENWLKLANELTNGNINSIHLLSRGQLVDDALDLGRSNRLGLDIVMAIIKYLRKEEEYVVWASADEGLLQLYRTFRGNDRNRQFSLFFNGITEFIYNELGASSTPDEMHHTKLARSLAIKWACLVGNSNCLSDTAVIMDRVIYQDHSIEADLRAVIYCNGMRNADSNKVTDLWNKFNLIGADRNLIIDGLICNENENNLKSFLSNIFGSGASDIEKRRAFNGLFAASATGLSSALEYFYENLVEIQTVYKTSLGTLLINVANQINTISEQKAFNSIIRAVESEIDSEVNSNVQSVVKNNLDYVDDHIDEIETYLASQYVGSATSLVLSLCVTLIITIVPLNI